MPSDRVVRAYAENKTDIHNALNRHVLPIIVVLKAISPEMINEHGDEPFSVPLSGFFVKCQGLHFAVIAGHVAGPLKASIDNGVPFEVKRAFLWEGFPNKPIGGNSEFTSVLKSTPVIPIHNTDGGEDYGAIFIPSIFAANIIAAGTLPINVTGIANSNADQPTDCNFESEADLYVLIGLPKETRKISLSSDGSSSSMLLELASPMLPIERIARPHWAVGDHPRFFGQILAMGGGSERGYMSLNDIDGMSGGPLFGIKFYDDRIGVDLVGIQSGWLRSRRQVSCCFAVPFVNFIADTIHEVIRSFPANPS